MVCRHSLPRIFEEACMRFPFHRHVQNSAIRYGHFEKHPWGRTHLPLQCPATIQHGGVRLAGEISVHVRTCHCRRIFDRVRRSSGRRRDPSTIGIHHLHDLLYAYDHTCWPFDPPLHTSHRHFVQRRQFRPAGGHHGLCAIALQW